MRVLKKSQIQNSGLNGTYFRTSQREGIKLFKNSYYSPQTLLARIKTRKLQIIIQEATIGKFAGTTKSLEIIKYNGRYYLGIVQFHRGNPVHLVSSKVLNQVRAKLRQQSIVHGDLHGKNIVRTKKQYYGIDFDPDHSYYVGDKKKYYTVKNNLIKALKDLSLS